jgi:hypothetical protein
MTSNGVVTLNSAINTSNARNGIPTNARGAGVNLMEANAQWRNRPADERFETLAALRESVNARRMRSRSVDIDRNDVVVEARENGALVVNSKLSACSPSHWAFGQLCQASKLNGVTAPASYLRQLPTPLAVNCLNEGLRSGDRESHKFMTITTPESTTNTNILQAVTSTTYGRIWDADVVDSVTRIVDRTGGKFFNPKDWSGKPSGLYASDHDVFMFMIDGGSIVDGGDRAQLHRGFFTWNSETGAKTFGLCTFLFNVVCGNHIIWGAQDVNRLVIRHTSGGPYRFDSQAAPALKAYSEASAAPIADAVRKAQGLLLPDYSTDDRILVDWAGKNGAKLTRSEVAEAVKFAKSEEGECRNVWQLVQGATAYARGFDFIDARVDLETRASKLLNLAANN